MSLCTTRTRTESYRRSWIGSGSLGVITLTLQSQVHGAQMFAVFNRNARESAIMPLERARTKILEINLCRFGELSYAARCCDLASRCINDFRKSAHYICTGISCPSAVLLATRGQGSRGRYAPKARAHCRSPRFEPVGRWASISCSIVVRASGLYPYERVGETPAPQRSLLNLFLPAALVWRAFNFTPTD
jgi:hypothetical protein